MIISKVHIIDDTLDTLANLVVENGLIQEVTILDERPDPAQSVWLPAFTDLHAHFRDPGLTYKEDVESGSRAAVRGGYTAVNLMPNTLPVVSSVAQARDVEDRISKLDLIQANQVVSMTLNEQGQDCSHLRDIAAGTIPFVSDDGKGVNRDDVMEEISIYKGNLVFPLSKRNLKRLFPDKKNEIDAWFKSGHSLPESVQDTRALLLQFSR